ncbi:hypothetical protein QBC46DRAFT_379056 [Diplogelasinospora grovesii]|uniref:PNPLA domain-containing protein n=1 Tax=Diplogelasinospora grovesii TaxID=303347 RepID=A0AAN6S6G9_9PEZI|nr:hypothetical protein QBC46DRAFT_379056 [Diplogelasinospora grovesii]
MGYTARIVFTPSPCGAAIFLQTTEQEPYCLCARALTVVFSTCSASAAAKMSDSHDVCVLALDGGGVRGLVSLLILRRLMHLINPRQPPKPCDVFDYIAGTSTGGLIAIMLGRLRMDVQTCIDSYMELSRQVFNPRIGMGRFARILQSLTGNAAFDHNALEEAIKGVVRDVLGDENAPFLEKNPKCKVFVCASMSNTDTVRLRNYTSESEEDIPCTIWEAGRATSAAPTFFDPITFSNGFIFRDGALRDNNPIFQLLHEVQAHSPTASIYAVVSIGTGVPKSLRVNSRLDSVAYSCVKISTDTENVARRFHQSYCRLGCPCENRYFRFNVRGVESVRLDEWRKADIMMSNTSSYLTDEVEKLKACAKLLTRDTTLASHSLDDQPTQPEHESSLSLTQARREKQPEHDLSLSLTRREKQPSPGAGSHSFYQLDRIGQQPVAYFAARKELDQIKGILDDVLGKPAVQILSLLGLGGSGKTQLMLQYASTHREEYGVVLWIDASSQNALSDSFRLAASQLGLRLPAHEAPTSTGTALSVYQSALDGDVALVKKELERRSQSWLLLFDQADDPDIYNSLRKHMPSAKYGRIIVSSRRKDANHLGQHWLEIQGLPASSARDLLLHHAYITSPTKEQLECAEKVVQRLDCIALAVDLAGSYIQTLGSIQAYLDLYETQREKLLMHSLGSSAPVASGYKDSVFAAWGMSISAIPEGVANFLYLLCLLDRSNLSKDLFRQACSAKTLWNMESGNIERVHPSSQGVPQWLLELFCDAGGKWCELKFHEAVSQISSLFFVEKEVFSGTWLHSSGRVETESLTADGTFKTLLRIPQPVHELGRYYIVGKTRQKFCYDAFSVVLHSFKNEVPMSHLPIGTNPLMYVGRGGMVEKPSNLQRQLEEAYNHVLVFKDDITDNSNHQVLCFDVSYPLWQRAEALMSASMGWQDLIRDNRDSAWEIILDCAQSITRECRGGYSALDEPSWAFLDVTEDFELKWAARNRYYMCISRVSLLGINRMLVYRTPIYSIAVFAEAECAVKRNLDLTLEETEKWTEECTEIRTGSKAFKRWMDSDMGQYFILRAKAVAGMGEDATRLPAAPEDDSGSESEDDGQPEGESFAVEASSSG